MNQSKVRFKTCLVAVFLAAPFTIAIPAEPEKTSTPVEPAAATFFLSPDQLGAAKRDAAKGCSQAAYRVAFHYLVAMDDVVEGKKWLLKAAQLGSVDAQYELGSILLDIPKQHTEGLEWVRRAAKGGSEKAKRLIELIELESEKSSK